MTVRVKLEYRRKVTKIETGYVCVDVPANATIGDAYRKAFDKDFVEYLPQNYDVQEEDWEFTNARAKESA